MIDFILSHDWEQILAACITVFGMTALIWYRKKIAAWKALWADVIEGLRAIPKLRDDVKSIAYFVSPNGGGSLMDSAHRTEEAVSRLQGDLTMLADTFAAENDTDEDVARFYSHESGENTYVNQTYARWLGVGKAELLGWGYMNVVHHDDSGRVSAHWQQCRSEARQYRMRHRMIRPDGGILLVDVIATPIPEGGPTKRWIGTVRKVPDGK